MKSGPTGWRADSTVTPSMTGWPRKPMCSVRWRPLPEEACRTGTCSLIREPTPTNRSCGYRTEVFPRPLPRPTRITLCVPGHETLPERQRALTQPTHTVGVEREVDVPVVVAELVADGESLAGGDRCGARRHRRGGDHRRRRWTVGRRRGGRSTVTAMATMASMSAMSPV